MYRSSVAPALWPPARCTTRTPTPPSSFSEDPRSASRCRSTTSCHWPTRGIWGPSAGTMPSGGGSPMTRPICRPSAGRPIRTRATWRLRNGCRPTARSRVSPPCSSSRCCVATHYPSTLVRWRCCSAPPRPARKADGFLTPGHQIGSMAFDDRASCKAQHLTDQSVVLVAVVDDNGVDALIHVLHDEPEIRRLLHGRCPVML